MKCWNCEEEEASWRWSPKDDTLVMMLCLKCMNLAMDNGAEKEELWQLTKASES